METRHIKYWLNLEPSRRDALVALVFSLRLLREALPIALKNVGGLDISSQIDFWRAFCAFDQETDLVDNGADLGDIKSINSHLETILDFAEGRLDQPTGTLEPT